MPYDRKSVEREGWRNWLTDNPAPNGWSADEFNVLMEYDAPTALVRRIWHCNWRTADKYVRNWKKQQHAPSPTIR